MRLTTSANFSYELAEESTFFFNFLPPSVGGQEVISETLKITPKSAKVEEFCSGPGQERTLRITAKSAKLLKIKYTAEVELTPNTYEVEDLPEIPVSQFDGELLSYIFPSRYCPSDRMRQVAGELFGQYATPTETVMAISDWIYENVAYVVGATFEQTAADEVFELRQGVCRDFAHLGIAFCRALNIPARYLSVYAWDLEPMDFHAIFEAWIGGKWVLFDATRMASLNAVVRIASGYDAANVPVATIFGEVTSFELSNDCRSNEAIGPDVLGLVSVT